MKREPLMSVAYFNEAISYLRSTIAERKAKLQNSATTLKKPQVLARANMRDCCELLISRYSVGEPVGDLSDGIEPIICAWEQALTLEPTSPNDFTYIDDYVRTLWLTSICLIFNVSEPLWQRLLVCAGNEGQDMLFERLVSSRTSGRKQASTLQHMEPYGMLNRAAAYGSTEDASQFLKVWYKGMRNVGWYDNHKGQDGGGFFGYWAIEVAGAVVACGIDDTKLLDLPYYPKDLAAYGKSIRR